MKSALLIIDVQNDMFEMPEKLHDPENLLSTIGVLIAKARKADSPVIYVQHNSDRGERFINGTRGWEIHSAIRPAEGDIIIQKSVPDSFYRTDLREILEKNGINRLVICGIQSELCIDTTTRAAGSLDLSVVLVSDGHSTFDRKTQNAENIVKYENEVLKGWFAEIQDSEKVSF